MLSTGGIGTSSRESSEVCEGKVDSPPASAEGPGVREATRERRTSNRWSSVSVSSRKSAEVSIVLGDTGEKPKGGEEMGDVGTYTGETPSERSGGVTRGTGESTGGLSGDGNSVWR